MHNVQISRNSVHELRRVSYVIKWMLSASYTLHRLYYMCVNMNLNIKQIVNSVVCTDSVHRASVLDSIYYSMYVHYYSMYVSCIVFDQCHTR